MANAFSVLANFLFANLANAFGVITSQSRAAQLAVDSIRVVALSSA